MLMTLNTYNLPCARNSSKCFSLINHEMHAIIIFNFNWRNNHRVVNNWLKFTQLESGREKFDSNPGNLSPVSMNLAPVLYYLLKENYLTIHFKSQVYTNHRTSTTGNNI